MDQTLMAIQTKFTIATFIGDEKMFREAVVNRPGNPGD
ncbi:host cell division inhibitory peptide Kil [Escherichia coli]|nr:host cell division inhibitory peptide Kil [Escherichia coli]